MSEQTEQATEAAIKAAGADAPRVHPEDLDAEIAKGSVHYFTAFHGIVGSNQALDPPQPLQKISGVPDSLRRLTFCVITLQNGFTVVGQSSCVSPTNFREQIGRDIALRNAREQLWPLLGFRLADTLHTVQQIADGTLGDGCMPVIKGMLKPVLNDGEGTITSQEPQS